MYKRPLLEQVLKRISEPRRFIQVLAGPRQTGKTTIARQVTQAAGLPTHYASADEPAPKDRPWIEQQWETARLQMRSQVSSSGGLLILDEIQKISDWSETVKRLWDEDTTADSNLRVLLLGSSPLLLQRGLADSLAGRFGILPVTHWSFEEMHDAFGWNLDQYVYFGGYPGAAQLIDDQHRWARYVLDSLIETSVSRDILLMTRVDKPALLRRLFEFGCSYSGRILSYQKMVGQLQEAGNTTTLAHYLELLKGAGLLTGLAKYSGQVVRQRASSPKLLVMN
ncbi:MAG: AAA family ATPase, partial [Candidatus Hydrogenedentes bacterium]|nr:AAA family ATPase [Candidatus Hydrogenedentota bacterium]